MTITDDIVKGLRNSTPLYAVAGTADLAAEKLREVPALIEKIREQAPDRIEKLRGTDPKVVQERVTTGAKDAQSKLNETFADLDLKEQLRDFKKMGESVQGFALQGVGRAAEYAVKTREAYDELAERGKDAVAKWRGETADEVVEIAAAMEPEPRRTQAQQSDAKPAAPKKPAARKPAAKQPADKSAE
jgi:hypothetical protein